MKADIFIPTSNRINSLKECLESLNKQTDHNFRVLLVGLKQSDGVLKLVNKYRNMRIDYFIQKQSGLVAAANEALRKSTNEIFIRIDDDVIVDKNWLKHLLKTYESDKLIGGVTGPTIMTADGLKSRDLTAFLEKFKKSTNPILKFVYFLYNNVLYENRMTDVSTFLESGVFTIGSNYKTSLMLKAPIYVNNLEACNWSCRTSILKKLGGFDERYTKGLGDYHEAAAAMRIQELGYRLVFNPQANLVHNVEAAGVEAARPAAFYRIQNFIYFYFRFYPIKNAKQLGKFFLNLGMQNGYFLFRFITTGKPGQLGAVFGTMIGLLKVLLARKT